MDLLPMLAIEHGMTRRMKPAASKPLWAQRLTAIRTLTGLSQGEFAAALGMSQQRYGLYETGKNEPNIDTLLKISNFTGHSVDFILRGPEAGLIPQGETDLVEPRGRSGSPLRAGKATR